ncbi:angiopoietin-1 isoform X2 [Engraulis encrasicolus]|uniref:angiopoietin-1 isoform X2 n=1 Tax=Engraulis encrasicolus TaxID=184585 RepID=UPI002FD11312
MKWHRLLACPLLSLAALLVVASCGLGVGGARDSESRRGGGGGTDGTAGTSLGRGGSSSSSSSSSSGPVGSSSSSSSSSSGNSNGGGSASGASSSSGRDRRYHRVQHGQCTYTFILPEGDVGGSSCRESKSSGTVAAGGATYSSGGGGSANANSLQRDAPPPEPDFPTQKIQQLEHVMENYTQWLQKIENYIRESMKMEMAQLQQSAVNNHTDAMLKMGTSLNSLTSLLSRTAEQARKLTDVETQVLNQTSRLEIQLLENSLSTNKLEKQLMLQTNEISKLHDKNGFLEQKMQEMEGRHREELEALREEKGSLQALVGRQIGVIRQLEGQLGQATGNSTALQRQQQDLMDTVHNLLNLCAKDGVIPNSTKQTAAAAAAEEEKTYKDCAELFKAGFQRNGVYTIQISSLEPRKVYCNMESAGGGWTVIQHREDGSVDFHRTWKEYKMGFGGVSGEHWLGNEFVYLLTSQRQYALRVELTDWDGHQAYSQYDRFHIGTEKQNYRLFLKSHTGTAGRLSSLVIHGADFSTKDVDNDNCMCKCALMLTGGWWFDACGPSNLNGMYYTQGQHVGKLNGIKWHYFKGPSYSLRATRMMIRPLDFS